VLISSQIYTFTHAFTYSRIHSFIHSRTNAFIIVARWRRWALCARMADCSVRRATSMSEDAERARDALTVPTTETATETTTTTGSSAEDADAPRRVVILFKATGDAPILKQNKVRVRADAAFADVVAHLNKLLKTPSASSSFTYLGASFTPDYAQRVGALCDAYGDGRQLVVFYSTTPAWG
jgi:ubiquitin-like protein ATG12